MNEPLIGTNTAQWRDRREGELSGAIVIHTSESSRSWDVWDLRDFVRTRSEPGSYNTISDLDKSHLLIHPSNVAFGEGTGGNKFAMHHAFVTDTEFWTDAKDPDYVNVNNNDVDEMLQASLEGIRFLMDHAKRQGIEVPAKRITAEQYFNGEPGFISHAELETFRGREGRRTDPGRDFPWDTLLSLLGGGDQPEEVQPMESEVPEPSRITDGLAVALQKQVNSVLDAGVKEDNWLGHETYGAVSAAIRDAGRYRQLKEALKPLTE